MSLAKVKDAEVSAEGFAVQCSLEPTLFSRGHESLHLGFRAGS